MKEDHRSILGTDIGTLAIESGGIVRVPKDSQQLVIGDLRRIEFHLHHFGVPGLVGTDILVGRVATRAAHITDRSGCNALGLAESGLNTPKASGPESCFFHTPSVARASF